MRVYVDTEYIFPGMSRESGRPTSKDLREIVQIAAVIFDDFGREIKHLDIFIKPASLKILPSFFIELTDITQDDLDSKGLSFSEGFDRFVKFCKDYPIFTFDKDYEVFEQNCIMNKVDFVFKNFPFVRVKSLLHSYGINPDSYSSGTLYQAVGLKIDGHVHNALHDVRSMALSLHFLENHKR